MPKKPLSASQEYDAMMTWRVQEDADLSCLYTSLALNKRDLIHTYGATSEFVKAECKRIDRLLRTISRMQGRIDHRYKNCHPLPEHLRNAILQHNEKETRT